MGLLTVPALRPMVPMRTVRTDKETPVTGEDGEQALRMPRVLVGSKDVVCRFNSNCTNSSSLRYPLHRSSTSVYRLLQDVTHFLLVTLYLYGNASHKRKSDLSICRAQKVASTGSTCVNLTIAILYFILYFTLLHDTCSYSMAFLAGPSKKGGSTNEVVTYR